MSRLSFAHSPLSSVVFALSLLVGMSSCQDEDFGYSADHIKYEKSFKNLYGDFPADKSWDMSSYTNLYNPDASNGSETRAVTRGGSDGISEGTHFDRKDWWEVPSQTLDWMKSALKEGKDNRYLGSNFVLQFPDNDFVIIPIFQGNSSINSELELKVNGYNITKIWGKNDDLLVNDHFLTDSELGSLPNPTDDNIAKYTNFTKDYKWHRLGYYNGWEYAADPDEASNNPKDRLSSSKTLAEIKAMDKEYQCEMYPSSMLKAKRVLSKPIYFRKEQFQFADGDGRFMYLSLHNIGKSWASWTDYNSRWDEGSDTWTTIGHRLTSINPEGHMLALNVPSSYRPAQSELPMVSENGKQPNQVIMVACEDANGSSSDHDVNDVVFLIIGYPNAPTIVPTKEVVEKRYMCEDLGGTYDFDFNDIVVDVSRTRYFKIHATPSNIEDPYVENIHIDNMELDTSMPEVQMATIAHVCGTLPIQARVGNYFFPKISDPTNQYQTRVELEGSGYMLSADDGAFTRAVPSGGYGTVAQPSGWNPNKTRIITDNSWDPDENNVRIYVEWPEDKDVVWDVDHKTQSNNGTHQHQSLTYLPADATDYFADFSGKNFKTVLFPDFYGEGEKVRIPYIIATDTNVPWMKEGKCVPPAWINGDFSAELGPLDTGDTDYTDHPADPGSCFFMEQYPAAAGEGRIWEGSITGMANTTGVAIRPGSPEMAALKEGRVGNRGYYLLNIYTEPMSGQTGRVGLSTFDSDGDWINLNSQYADGYLQYASRSEGRFADTSLDCSDWECTTIYLTDADWADIEQRGLIVTSKTDGLVIRKITTSRPIVLKKGSESDKDIYGDNRNILRDGDNTVIIDKGYTINITVPENGSIRGTERERIADIKTIEEGATDSQIAAIKSHNASETARASVPFLTSHYSRYATVGLTAVAKPGYAFDYWTVNGSKDASRSSAETIVSCPYDVTTQAAEGSPSEITISAVFKEANDPHLSLLPTHKNNVARLDTVLTIAKGTKFTLGLRSDNMGCVLSTFGGNADVASLETVKGQYAHNINITGNAVGTTSFLVYQKDYGTYGVSEEISVKVNVVEVPARNVELTPDRFHRWDKFCTPNPSIVGAGTITNRVGEKVTNSTENNYGQVVLGSRDNDKFEYTDLTQSDYLIINMGHFDGDDTDLARDQKLTAPRLYFNWADGSNTQIVANDPKYSTVINNSDPTEGNRYNFGTVTYVVNLKEVRNRNGYFSTLTNIQTNFGKAPQCTYIASVYVDKYDYSAESVRTVSVSAVNGTATVNDQAGPVSVSDGQTVTLIATANNIPSDETEVHRYTFDGWYIGDEKVSVNPTYQYTPISNVSIKAVFISEWRVIVDTYCKGHSDYAGYVNVEYDGTWSGKNDLWVPVGKTVKLHPVPSQDHKFNEWAWSNGNTANPRTMIVSDRTGDNLPNHPAAEFVEFGEDVYKGTFNALDWDASNNHCYVFTLDGRDGSAVNLKNTLGDGINTLSFVMDSRITSIQILTDWNADNEVVGPTTVTNGKCEITFTPEAIAKMNTYGKGLFMQILSPGGQIDGLTLTKIRRYGR